MSLKTLVFMLFMIMLLGVLAGCTPKTQEPTESYTVPGLESGSETLPENESGQKATDQPGNETANSNESTPAESNTEDLPIETDAQMEDPDEGGLEIESEYTVEIGDDLGVGGN